MLSCKLYSLEGYVIVLHNCNVLCMHKSYNDPSFPVRAGLGPAVELVKLILSSDGQAGIAVCVKVSLNSVPSADSYPFPPSSQCCVSSREWSTVLCSLEEGALS